MHKAIIPNQPLQMNYTNRRRFYTNGYVPCFIMKKRWISGKYPFRIRKTVFGRNAAGIATHLVVLVYEESQRLDGSL